MSFLSDAEKVIFSLNEYYEDSKNARKPVIFQKPIAELKYHFDLDSYAKNGGMSEKGLMSFLDKYLNSTTRMHHPGYFAHQVAPVHYSGVLGTLIDSFINNVTSIYEMGSGATCVEYFIINWLLKKVGWQPAPWEVDNAAEGLDFAGGILTHGGSLANLTGLIAARKKLVPDVWKKGNPNDLALLASSDCHYSIERAAGILGIGKNSIYHLDVDKRGAIIPEQLSSAHGRLLQDGKRPVALVANACSTAVGIYDPLEEIGDYCNEKGIWLHIDGTHGASALLSQKHKTLLRGIEKANSITWDAHKLMQTPALCAALLVRDHRTIDNAFEQEASYIFHEKEQPGFDFIHRTVECTKPGLGLKLFLVLALYGENRLSAYIDRQFALTLQAYEYIEERDDFDCPVKPQSNVLCFRIKGSDRLQLTLRDKVNKNGNFYLSTTLFKNVRYLRIVVMSSNTQMTHIKRLVKELRKQSAILTD